MPYRRILVPIDGSNASNRALEEAVRLAVEQTARVRLIHVIEDPYSTLLDQVDDATVERAWRQAGQAVLDRAVAAARQLGTEPEAALVEAEGQSPGQAILAEASRWDAALIVMGTRGRHGLGRLVLGSVAESVAREAPMPVLLVHGA